MSTAPLAYIQNQLLDAQRFSLEHDFPEGLRNDVLTTVCGMNDSLAQFSAMATVRHGAASEHAEEDRVALVYPNQGQ
ncbi:hypothetical protein BJN34_11450 [Cupriavidus necator]|uniref:Uncharacterized protein n=1 Tax=Cupriavidus necator TaxID=106590 RepID=A0A1U9UQG9_CUPNE|nr:hypothetical protein BJN34_11450 [Cupriavidus necator]